ncbi:hypothetical protein GXB76_24720, partial [Citrobacter freundii]|nr:hypothetical protein [Citrobacter freundii]
MVMSLQMVMFAYGGGEGFGGIAGGGEEPGKTISRAIHFLTKRVLVVFVGGVFVRIFFFPREAGGGHGGGGAGEGGGRGQEGGAAGGENGGKGSDGRRGGPPRRPGRRRKSKGSEGGEPGAEGQAKEQAERG